MKLGLITRRSCCSSSVVERVIGNDEVGSSILPYSTIHPTLFTRTAIRSNNYAGGDNCCFATFVGALAGAVYGVDGDAGIPQAWIDRLDARTKIDTILSKLFG